MGPRCKHNSHRRRLRFYCSKQAQKCCSGQEADTLLCQMNPPNTNGMQWHAAPQHRNVCFRCLVQTDRYHRTLALTGGTTVVVRGSSPSDVSLSLRCKPVRLPTMEGNVAAHLTSLAGNNVQVKVTYLWAHETLLRTATWWVSGELTARSGRLAPYQMPSCHTCTTAACLWYSGKLLPRPSSAQEGWATRARGT